jgi:hypothetical protein
MEDDRSTSETKETAMTRTASTNERPRGDRRRRLLRAGSLAGLAGLSLLASACGGAPRSSVAQLGSSTSGTAKTGTGPAPTGKYAAALAYSRCMRSHGVPDFPDPKQVAGGGIQVAGSQAGMSPSSPIFASAERSCRHLLAGGGQPTHADRQRALTRMLHVSQCMRAHGIPGFPDPTLAPPASRSGDSDIMSNDGVWLAIPGSIDVHAPAFERAAAACNLGLS